MTDLEMTRLCAEAMGIALTEYKSGSLALPVVVLADSGAHPYTPLHDDAQAMALDGYLLQYGDIAIYKGRFVFAPYSLGDAIYFDADMTKAENRRRARVECVAKLKGHADSAPIEGAEGEGMDEFCEPPFELDDVSWLHRFLNCTVFGPPPSEIQRAHEIVNALSAAKLKIKEREG